MRIGKNKHPIVSSESEKAAGEGSLFHEGSININKGLYNAKDLGESLARFYITAWRREMQ